MNKKIKKHTEIIAKQIESIKGTKISSEGYKKLEDAVNYLWLHKKPSINNINTFAIYKSLWRSELIDVYYNSLKELRKSNETDKEPYIKPTF